MFNNRTYYFYNDMINIEKFDPNLLKIDKKSYKDIDIYYTGYITIKNIDDCQNIYNVSPLYLITVSHKIGPQKLLKINPQTLLKIDPQTLLEIDPRTLLKIDPQTLPEMDPQVLFKTDPQVLLDTQTLLKIDPQLLLEIVAKMLLKISFTSVTQS